MNEKTIKIVLALYGILLLIIIIFLALLFQRTKNISNNQTANISGIVQPGNSGQAKLKGILNDFSGKISETGSNFLMVQVEVPDIPKPKDSSDPQMGKAVPVDAYGKKLKNVKVNIDSNTKFSTKKLSDFRVGDSVRINSDKMVINSDELTALVVSVN